VWKGARDGTDPKFVKFVDACANGGEQSGRHVA
jgi:hypothetical protein